VHLGPLPKKRYKHIHVRLGSAIHGSAHFWEAPPNAPAQTFQQ